MLEKIFRTVVLCVLTRGGHCGVRISGFTSSEQRSHASYLYHHSLYPQPSFSDGSVNGKY